jgi:hypothetical protein
MTFFRVKAGAHAGPGRASKTNIATVGEVVEADEDLVAMFGKDKLEVVADAEAKKSLKEKKKATTELPKEVEMPDRENPVDPGEMADTTPKLDPPGKREQLLADTAPLRRDDPNVKTTAKAEKAALGEDEDDEDDEDDGDYGDDMSSDFDLGEDDGVSVWKKGKVYTVYDAETDEVLNDGEMTNKTQVKQFLKDYLGDDDTEE